MIFSILPDKSNFNLLSSATTFYTGPNRLNPQLLSDHLDLNPLIPFPVKFLVEDLFPGSKIKPAFCDGHYRLPAHDRPLQMSVRIVLIAVMVVQTVGFLRGQSFQPLLIILMQTALVIIDEYAGCDVHRVHQHQSFLDSALGNRVLYHLGDIDPAPPGRDMKM